MKFHFYILIFGAITNCNSDKRIIHIGDNIYWNYSKVIDSIGMKLIPQLINNIEYDLQTDLEPKFRTNSYYDSCLANNYIGIKNALIIEKIVKNDSIKRFQFYDEFSLYICGLIFKKKN